uniref:Cytoplasmic protein n=1 Tax=Shewanella putrefaciens (strain 200) TaxID=399804 RepID=E6XHI9_SHEP2
MDQQQLIDAVNQTMPFGKYAGRKLLELPEPYLVWFHKQGVPQGKLGEQLALMYEIKLNGLEGMLKPLLK